MRRAVALMVAAALAAAGLWLWLRALGYSDRLDQDAGYRFQLDNIAPFSPETFSRLEREENPYAFAEENEVTVTAPQFGRTARVTMMRVLGNPGLLFPAARLLSGAYPSAGIYGCVVDMDTAFALWGSHQVIGKEVAFGGDTYTITGVLDTGQPVMVAPRLGGGEYSPRHGAYRPGSDAPYPSQEMDNFVSRVGLSTSGSSDLGRTGQLLRLAALFPVWLLCMVIGWRCLRQLLPKHLFLSVCLLLVVGYLVSRALDAPPLVTPDMVPTQWADFAFWSRQVSSGMQELYARFLSPGTIPEYILLRGTLLPALGWSAAATACFLVAVRLLRTAAPPVREQTEQNA